MFKTRLLLLSLFSLFAFNGSACDDGTFTFNSETDNGDGTYTYSMEVCNEMLGLEGMPDWFQIAFSGGTFTTISTFAPASVSTSGGDNYNGSLVSGNTAIRYNSAFVFGTHNTALMCHTYTITTNGRPATIDINYHDTNPQADCYETYTLPVTPPACDIASLTATPSACNAGDNSYTVDITVTYTNPPASGTLNVNGESVAITASPQVVTITGLNSDGNTVNVTAAFSADVTCTLTTNSVYTAPASCTCGANAGTISN